MEKMTYEQALTQLEWGERNGKIETFYRIGGDNTEFIHFCTVCERSSYHHHINGIEGCTCCLKEKTATEVAA